MLKDLQTTNNISIIQTALADIRRTFWSVTAFSGLVNLLMLAGPLYMLQVYDRVLSSRSVPTLMALTALLVGAYAFQGLLDLVRSRIVVRAAGLLDEHLSAAVYSAVVHFATQNGGAGEAHQPVRDLDQIRAFMTGAGPIAIVDLPWIPVFLALCFLIHPWLGALSLFGGAVLFALAFLTERASRTPAQALSREAGMRGKVIEAHRRNSEVALAMGMAPALLGRWLRVNDRYLAASERAADVVSTYGSSTKVLRLLLQSGILGFGAYLVIQQDLTAGAMIAASIMMGRALAPVETAIGNWRTFISARQSIRRLSQALARVAAPGEVTVLHKPKHDFAVEDLFVMAPGTQAQIVTGVHFSAKAGEAVGIIGPSGAGKTSLMRTLIGAWPPAKGSIRFDGAALDQWSPEERGKSIGYVPQDVELFEGTVAENIARMSPEPNSDWILAAATAAGAHDMIVRLPNGYDTRIGEDGRILSGGQRQRLALARAFYGAPFLLALDEPNSNLDHEGEIAFHTAIRNAKARGAVVIVIAHRPSALSDCDKVVFLAQGTQQAFGPRDEVLRKVLARSTPSTVASNLQVVDTASGASRD